MAAVFPGMPVTGGVRRYAKAPRCHDPCREARWPLIEVQPLLKVFVSPGPPNDFVDDLYPPGVD